MFSLSWLVDFVIHTKGEDPQSSPSSACSVYSWEGWTHGYHASTRGHSTTWCQPGVRALAPTFSFTQHCSGHFSYQVHCEVFYLWLPLCFSYYQSQVFLFPRSVVLYFVCCESCRRPVAVGPMLLCCQCFLWPAEANRLIWTSLLSPLPALSAFSFPYHLCVHVLNTHHSSVGRTCSKQGFSWKRTTAVQYSSQEGLGR